MENSNYMSPANNPHLLNTFREEAHDLVSQLEDLLLEVDDANVNIETVNSIFRVMHTLKGAGAIFGFNYITDFTHKMEDVYDKIRNEELVLNNDIISVTLSSVDLIRNLINNPDVLPDNFQKLTDRILSIAPSIPNNNLIASNQNNTSFQRNFFYIYFNPGSDVLFDGTNPLYLIQDLNNIGKCLVEHGTIIQPDETYDPLKNYSFWHIIIDTTCTINDIEDNFMFLAEKFKPVIKRICPSSELDSLDSLASFFKNKAQQTGIISDIELIFENRESVKLIDNELIEVGRNELKSKADFSKEADYQKDDKIIKTEISSIRVSTDKIDVLLNFISELITKQAELTLVCANYGNAQLQEIAEGIETLSHNLQETAFSISLMPLEQSLIRFKRMVHDVSAKVGKKVILIIEGGDTELDKTIIENILDPIMHLIRNSIDHGLETPEVRLKAGKPEQGTILLKAFYTGANVIIQISDDGTGIDLGKVRAKAINKGILKETDNPSDEELIQIILQPGFSTAEIISDISGRGVGMDVVNQKIRDVRGDISIKTVWGKGTTSTIMLPLTISIIDALLVKIGTSSFLISLSSIEACEEITYLQLNELKDNYLIVNDSYIPVINLSDEFDIPFLSKNYFEVILVKYHENIVGLIVDQIIGKFQAVLKSLGELYRNQEFVSGASILGNGEVALMLDTNKLIRKVSGDRKKWLKTTTLITTI